MSDKKSAVEIMSDTMVGDLRDAALGWIKTFDKPWQKMPQSEQQTVIESVTRQARALVIKAVEILISDARTTISGHVESVTIKDGLKVVLTCAANELNLISLGMRQGQSVYVVVADTSAYDGEKAPAKPDPDQPELIVNGAN